MPNHVTNVITAERNVIQACLNESGDFDFSNIIPKPESLYDKQVDSSLIDRAKLALGLLREPYSNPRDLTEVTSNMEFSNCLRLATSELTEKEKADILVKIIQSYMNTGSLYWYDWNNHNWGTKWNCYSVEDRGGSYKFETAWSCPIKVFSALSKKFPNEKIIVNYADEDWGNNCGIIHFLDGEAIDEKDFSGTKEGIEFALKLIYREEWKEKMKEFEL